jgi:hypothetical protein
LDSWNQLKFTNTSRIHNWFKKPDQNFKEINTWKILFTSEGCLKTIGLKIRSTQVKWWADNPAHLYIQLCLDFALRIQFPKFMVTSRFSLCFVA